IVASREMTLDELSVLKERTGMEIEYFVHGDMCMSEGGQCIHSGVLFGESSNRGRCLKPCRWPYKLIDENTGDVLDGDEKKAYKLALKDMCMYRNLRDLITAGVYSFKIEGRMRPPEFVRRIVSIYRRAIDAYLADPAGYHINEADYKKLYDGRARDFTTAFALGKPTADDIGFDGSREPQFFSKAIKEAAIEDKAPNLISDFNDETDKSYHHLAVRVRDMNGLFAACDNGADDVYIGGEAYLPNKPWTLDDIRRAMEIAREYDVRVIVMTPRTTHTHELVEMRSFLTAIDKLRPAGISVGNIGMLELAAEYTCLPIQTDFALNIFNHEATKLLEENRVSMATASLELSLLQLRTLIASSRLPIEVIVHGAYESMICDHNIPAMSLPYDRFASESFDNHRYALLDAAGEKHPLRMDQYGRDHIYFAKDLCLYQYIKDIEGAASYRIEAQDYSPELTGKLTKLYRQVLDGQIESEEMQMKKLREIEAISPRKFGIGAFRFKT
ncbi:MAG: peptidase U32 family protein, partial [Selenomonadaceae bacterium]